MNVSILPWVFLVRWHLNRCPVHAVLIHSTWCRWIPFHQVLAGWTWHLTAIETSCPGSPFPAVSPSGGSICPYWKWYSQDMWSCLVLRSWSCGQQLCPHSGGYVSGGAPCLTLEWLFHSSHVFLPGLCTLASLLARVVAYLSCQLVALSLLVPWPGCVVSCSGGLPCAWHTVHQHR